MQIGDSYPYKPGQYRLKPGLHCKGCDSPISDIDDPELCMTCMGVVHELNKDIYAAEEEAAFQQLLEEYENE